MADGSASARIAASPARRCFDLRAVALPLHRHMGLALAGFLILSGLTGSILVFQREIDAAINPGLWAASEGGPRLSPDQIAARIEAWDPRVRARWIPIEDGKAPDVWVDPKIDPATGAPFAVPFNQVFVDPVSGAINGSRPYGGWPPTVETLIPFTDMFHRNMMIPGMWGTWLMGAVGLIWFFDSITGAYLTFPRGRPFFRKWRPAWAIKADAAPVRLNMDLHRAGGLWLWGVLIILAVSGVAFTLEHEVFEPVVSMVSPISENAFEHRPMDPLNPVMPAFGFDEAIERARALGEIPADVEASGLYYAAELGGYGVAFGEAYQPGLGPTWVYIDGVDGSLIELTRPGAGTGGDVFAQAQLPLHSGQILGLPSRLVVFFAGIATVALSVTGVIIYIVKLRARRRRARR